MTFHSVHHKIPRSVNYWHAEGFKIVKIQQQFLMLPFPPDQIIRLLVLAYMLQFLRMFSLK